MWSVLRSTITRLAAKGVGRAVLLAVRLVIGMGRLASGMGRLASGWGRVTSAAGLAPRRASAAGLAPRRRSSHAPGLRGALARARGGGGVSPRPMSPWRLVGGAMATLVLVGLLGGASLGAAHLTSSSGVCKQCHEMGSYYESWSASAHSGAECAACHIRPGIIGLVKAKLNGVRQLYVHVVGGERMPLQLTADVPDEACRTCHPQSARGARRDAGFGYHPVHEGIRCILCHQGVVHGRDPERPPLGSMASCLECHSAPRYDGAPRDRQRDGTSAPSACGTCHEPPHADTGECAACHELTDWAEPVPLSPLASVASCRLCHGRPRDVAGATYLFTHGQHEAVGCTSCHGGDLHPSAEPVSVPTMEECLECHDGATREGVTASAACETCHRPPHADVGECAQCHTAAGWREPMPLAETVATAACLGCHRLQGSVSYGGATFSHSAHRSRACSACHGGIAHPVAGAARRLSMEACTDCHARTGAPSSCAVCHSPPHARYGDCSGCHSRSSWKPRFVHPLKLVGRHATVGCAACHGGTPVLGAANTRLSAACADCHADSAGPGHDGLGECGSCHDPGGWTPPTFAHPEVPGMDRSGMACSQCHPVGYASYSCAPCHAAAGP